MYGNIILIRRRNVIDVHISRLRSKIDKDFEKPLLKNGAGRGLHHFRRRLTANTDLVENAREARRGKKRPARAKSRRKRATTGVFRLFRTTSFRFTLFFVLLFTWAVGVLGAFVYRASFGAASEQTDVIIDAELSVLANLFGDDGPGMLTRVIRQRTAWRDDSIYMLIGAPSGVSLAGNLTALPPEALTAEGAFFRFRL